MVWFRKLPKKKRHRFIHVRPMRPVFVLDLRKLPRGLRHVCLQWNIVQSRESSSRRNFCNTENHARLANIALGLESCLHKGNIDALRDWGHARDYVRMQWMMLQQDEAKDYVIATGKQYSVREFITVSNALGIDIEFRGLESMRLAS